MDGSTVASGIKDQYRKPDGIQARIGLHAKFSTAEVSWPKWVFNQIDLTDGECVLEVGCGSAWFWDEAAELVPPSVSITITDRSDGMVRHASEKLAHTFAGSVDFRQADVMRLPYDDNEFDVALANHMLYLVENRREALQELRRVVGPRGRLFCATNGPGHLIELNQLAERFLLPGRRLFDGGLDTSPFSLSNGRAQIGEVFEHVTSYLYDDGLLVTDADALCSYVESLPSWRDQLDMKAFTTYVQQVVSTDCPFRVTKSTGLFKAWG